MYSVIRDECQKVTLSRFKVFLVNIQRGRHLFVEGGGCWKVILKLVVGWQHRDTVPSFQLCHQAPCLYAWSIR